MSVLKKIQLLALVIMTGLTVACGGGGGAGNGNKSAAAQNIDVKLRDIEKRHEALINQGYFSYNEHTDEITVNPNLNKSQLLRLEAEMASIIEQCKEAVKLFETTESDEYEVEGIHSAIQIYESALSSVRSTLSRL